jgi:hypothetical protein
VTDRPAPHRRVRGATISNRELNFTHQIHAIGLHIRVLSQTAPDIFAELMRELSTLMAAGVFPAVSGMKLGAPVSD